MSKGPAKLRSGFPKDKRPPKRGKSGSPLATGTAKAKTPASGPPTGTSRSGQPTAASDLSKIPSTDASRKKSSAPEAEPPKKARKLSEREIRERETNIAKHYARIRNLEREKKRLTLDISSKLKPLKKELDRWSEEVELKRELIAQDEIDFEEDDELQDGEGAETQSIREVGAPPKGNGNAHDFGEEPAPEIDPNQAGPTRIEASRAEEDDITRAANADAAGAHA